MIQLVTHWSADVCTKLVPYTMDEQCEWLMCSECPRYDSIQSTFMAKWENLNSEIFTPGCFVYTFKGVLSTALKAKAPLTDTLLEHALSKGIKFEAGYNLNHFKFKIIIISLGPNEILCWSGVMPTLFHWLQPLSMWVHVQWDDCYSSNVIVILST